MQPKVRNLPSEYSVTDSIIRNSWKRHIDPSEIVIVGLLSPKTRIVPSAVFDNNLLLKSFCNVEK